MKFTPTAIPEVIEIDPVVFEDQRGHFVTTFQEKQFVEAGIDVPFVQDNESSSRANTLRGLHYQHPHGQGKLVRVVHGAVYDVAVDIRRGSPTFGRWVASELSESNRRMLWVPAGFAHGFCVLSERAVFVYKCSDFYAPECEHTILWNDPDIGIDWPVADPILSDKDRAGTALAEANAADLPSYG